VADRSLSVPMTLSDLEKRDAMVKFFEISIITLVWFDLEWPKLA